LQGASGDRVKTPPLRPDIVAGLTAAAVVLPKAMAYATVAGLPVAVGLYTALVPVAVYAWLGTSRVLSVSSTTTIGILTGAQLAVLGTVGTSELTTALATLGALVGAILVVARLAHLGFVANFVSSPVLTGFKAGIGLVIVLDQLPKLLGLHLHKTGFFRDVGALVEHLPETSLATLALGGTTLVALLLLERFAAHSPAPLVALGGGILASYALDLPARGVAIVGAIPGGLPTIALPDVGLVEALLPGAFGIALMSFTESIAAARAFADKDDPPLDANRELLATGVANLAGSLIGAMPAGGGTSQTAVVRAAGGRSQVASLVTAAAAALTMLVLAPLLGLLPQASLAAVVIVYSLGLIQPSEFVAIRMVRTMEFRWALVACAGVLLLGTLKGILVAIVASLISLSAQAAQPHVYAIGRKRGADVLRPLSAEYPDDETIPGLLIARPEGRIFFANVESVASQIARLIRQHRPRVVALDMSRVPDIEYSALQLLMDLDRRAKAQQLEWWLVGLNPRVREVVARCGLADQLGRERMLFNARVAISKFRAENASAGERQPEPSARGRAPEQP
jgi:high affinity sulfate transporter 1